MPKILRKCVKCGKYSLSDECRFCSSQTRNPHPMSFSIADKYDKYRRKASK